MSTAQDLAGFQRRTRPARRVIGSRERHAVIINGKPARSSPPKHVRAKRATPTRWITLAQWERDGVRVLRPMQRLPGVNDSISNLRLSARTGLEAAVDPDTGARYNVGMRIIARRTLREFWEKHPDARQALQAWYADVKRAEWKSPSEIKAIYRTASFLANNRVVFNVKGNQYRLIVVIQYQHGIVYIRFVGTHQEYDRIDAARI